MKPMCPHCGKELFLQQVLRAYKSTRISKDGSLSKRSKNIINKEDSDAMYLYCNNCRFSYNLTYKDLKEEEIQKLEDWYNENF